MHAWRSGFTVLAAAWIATAAAELPSRIPVKALFANPTIDSPVISMDGKQVAYVLSQGDLQVIVARPLAGGAAKPLIKFEETGTRLSWLRWANDTRLLISAQTRSQSAIHVASRETRMFGVDLDGRNFTWLGKGWPVYGQDSLAVRFQDDIVHVTPRDPATLLMSIWPPYEQSPMVAQVDVANGKFRRVEERHDGVTEWFADSNGDVRAGEGVSNDRYQLWFRQEAGAKFEKVIERRMFEEDGPEFAGFHSDPARIYVTSLHGGRDAVFEFDTRTKTLGALVFADPRVDVDGIERDSGPERRAIGVAYTVDRPEVHFFDDTAEREYLSLGDTLRSEFGFAVSHDTISQSADGTRQLLAVWADRQPPVFYCYDRTLKRLVRLFEQRPGVRAADLAPTRRIDFTARDGLPISGYLTLPVGIEPKQLPVIALVHGGPWSRDSIGWDPEVQLLANRGYAVLQVNFRGSSGLGQAFLQAGYREWGQKIQDDITDGVKWLIAQGVADPDRIGIMGSSYGGYATLVGLAKTPELYRAGAAYASVTDIELLISDDKWYDWGYDWHQTMVGGERGDKTRLRESSPLRHVADIRVPVLLGHGTDDQRVHVRQSQRMAEALKKAGKDYQYLEFPDEVHGFLLEANRVRWYETLIDFFDRNLAARAPAAAVPP